MGLATMIVRLSAGSYNPSTNSTTVSATVYMTWDTSESYNQENKTGTLTIGSYSTTFSTNFNASRLESGTQILGGGSTTIYHNTNGDPVTVTAHASGAGRSASDSITLPGGTPSTDSGGGDSGGGDSGGDGDSGDSGGSSGGGSYEPDLSLSSVKFSIFQDSHTRLKVILIDGCDDTATIGQEIKNGDVLQWLDYYGQRPTIQVLYEFESGYGEDEHTLNGVNITSGESWYVNKTTCNIRVTSKIIEQPYVGIDNSESIQLHECFIEDGETWYKYAPYIAVENTYKWEGLFPATVTATDGLNLREQASTSTNALIVIPYNTEIKVEEFIISADGSTIWMKTTYSNYTGWCSGKYLDFTMYGKISNLNSFLYQEPSIDSTTIIQLVLNQEIFTYKLLGANGIIWCYTSFKDENNETKTGYIKVQDLTILSERTVLEWVPCWLGSSGNEEVEEIKYLYKDGILYEPFTDGFNAVGSTINNYNSNLKYTTTYNYRNYKTRAINKTPINLSNFKYLCIKVGNICEYSASAGSLVQTFSTSSGNFYVGINTGRSDLVLTYAMRLTPSDSNGSYYADISNLDLIGNYWIGFGTEEIGQIASFYIKEMWVSNELEDGLVQKSFNNTLGYQGAVG